jgi:endonuclease YncB( thermonuclease family)
VRRGLVLTGLVLLLALLLAPSGPAAPAQFFRIQYVIDGDTVVLANGEHVRLVQIDSPELRGSECYGAQARPPCGGCSAGNDRARRGRPRLDQVDRYGRLLRYIFLGPTNVNLQLVRVGAATVWFYDHDRGSTPVRSSGRSRRRAAHRGLREHAGHALRPVPQRRHGPGR